MELVVIAVAAMIAVALFYAMRFFKKMIKGEPEKRT